jgi:Zn-dependent protease with chaperone function
MRRSFWALVLLALVGEAGLSALASRALWAQLPCRVRGWELDVPAMAACLKPVPLVGRHALGAALVMGGVALATLVLAAVELARQLWRLRQVRRLMATFPRASAEPPKPPGAPLRALVVLGTEEPCCFTIGLFQPVVVVSTGLLQLLGPNELGSALSHEAAHARRLGPLRQLAASVAASAVFFVPVLRDLAQAAQLQEELRADRAAVARYGEAALLSALRPLLAGPQVAGDPRAALSSMARPAMLQKRLEALSGDYPRIALRRPRLVASVAGVVLLALVGFAVPGQVTAPVPLQAHPVPVPAQAQRLPRSSSKAS